MLNCNVIAYEGCREGEVGEMNLCFQKSCPAYGLASQVDAVGGASQNQCYSCSLKTVEMISKIIGSHTNKNQASEMTLPAGQMVPNYTGAACTILISQLPYNGRATQHFVFAKNSKVPLGNSVQILLGHPTGLYATATNGRCVAEPGCWEVGFRKISLTIYILYRK